MKGRAVYSLLLRRKRRGLTNRKTATLEAAVPFCTAMLRLEEL